MHDYYLAILRNIIERMSRFQHLATLHGTMKNMITISSYCWNKKIQIVIWAFGFLKNLSIYGSTICKKNNV